MIRKKKQGRNGTSADINLCQVDSEANNIWYFSQIVANNHMQNTFYCVTNVAHNMSDRVSSN